MHELRGEPLPTGPRAQVSLGVELQVPEDYVEDPLQRLMVSKRLASANTTAQLEALQSEVRDRYGPIPAPVEQLFALGALRQAAEQLGVAAIERQGDRLAIRLDQQARVDTARIASMLPERPEWSLAPPDRLMVTTGVRPASELISRARDALDALPVSGGDSGPDSVVV